MICTRCLRGPHGCSHRASDREVLMSARNTVRQDLRTMKRLFSLPRALWSHPSLGTPERVATPQVRWQLEQISVAPRFAPMASACLGMAARCNSIHSVAGDSLLICVDKTPLSVCFDVTHIDEQVGAGMRPRIKPQGLHL